MSFLRKQESIASDIYKFLDSRFGENNNYFLHKPNPETEFGATNFVGARWAFYENNPLSTGTVRHDHTLNPWNFFRHFTQYLSVFFYFETLKFYLVIFSK